MLPLCAGCSPLLAEQLGDLDNPWDAPRSFRSLNVGAEPCRHGSPSLVKVSTFCILPHLSGSTWMVSLDLAAETSSPPKSAI